MRSIPTTPAVAATVQRRIRKAGIREESRLIREREVFMLSPAEEVAAGMI
jgi:hypothetical protein